MVIDLADPGQFPHSIDLSGDRMLIVRQTEAELIAASFLDGRAFAPQTRGEWLALDAAVRGIDPAARDDAQYIFHIGHAGSTLLSRLLGAIPGVLALREPLVLRSVAEVEALRGDPRCPWKPHAIGPRVAMLRRLLARTFRPDQRAMIKGTSWTSEIAPLLVAPGARALFLTVSPQSYFETILAGEASRQELAILAPARIARLMRRGDGDPPCLWELDESGALALAWATEMTSLEAAADVLPPRSVMWLDFDAFLADPARVLTATAAHFGLPLDGPAAAALTGGPIMQRYSKAPEHAYTPQLRAQVRAQAAHEHRAAIARAHGWLKARAAVDPATARVMARY